MKLAGITSLGARLAAWFPSNTRRRRLALGIAIYVVCTIVFFACAPRQLLTDHTKANHFALLADCWKRGRLDLGHPPPPYTQNNDFADFNGKTFISFPPFPAVILLPALLLAKTPENLRDGQMWLWLSGVGPALLFLVLEKLRRMGESVHKEWENLLLSFIFAFGTVYFFTAEQGTVWFAAHVVVVSLMAIYVLNALDAERPVIAGIALGLGFLTRPDVLVAAPFLLFEVIRKARRDEPRDGKATSLGDVVRKMDFALLLKKLVAFAVPIVIALAITAWHNRARFGTLQFGHEHLTVGWRARIDKWGLFSYHYLARNLGIVTSSLPYMLKVPPWFQINTHGLALWVTTPIYVRLLWPRQKSAVWWALVAGILPVAFMLLLYQNSGWLQFGYRFSNDYAVLLFALLVVSGFRFRTLFYALAVWGIAVNTFGALTFERNAQYYYTDGSQATIFQPD